MSHCVEMWWQGLKPWSALVSYEHTVCYKWLPVISTRSVWPQWHSLEWSQRCVQSLIHLCKPAITGIIGLPTCAAHCGLHYPQACVRSVSGVCVCSCRCSRRWVMDVAICCILHTHVNHSFIQSIFKSTPPPEQLSCSATTDTHCQTCLMVSP